MVKAGDGDAADVVVVQRSAIKKRAKQSCCHCSSSARPSPLHLFKFIPSLFCSPLGIYHLISHRWEALVPPTHASSRACKYVHTYAITQAQLLEIGR